MPISDRLVGNWLSPVRQTQWGPMVFDFHFGADGQFEVTGEPATQSSPETWRRRGSYRLKGNQFSSPVVNEGNPVEVHFEGAALVFKVDDSLTFRLRRY